jgi:hypothetical protein
MLWAMPLSRQSSQPWMGRRETMPPQRLGNQMPQMMAAAAEVAEAVGVAINSPELRIPEEPETV